MNFEESEIHGEALLESQVESQLQEGQVNIDLFHLIEIIQSYDYLYDLSHKEYKNAKKKDLAWREISTILGAPVDTCMKAWRNVRDRFCKEKNKLRSGSEAVEVTWPYFDAMQFYNKHTKRRSTYSSVKTPKAAKLNPEPSTSRASPPVSRSSSAMSTWSNVTMATVFSPTLNESESANREIEEIMNSSSELNKETKKKSKVGDPDLKGIIAAAENIASRLNKTEGQASDVNKKFCEYEYSRLSEISDADARELRKKMLIILENIDV